MLTSIEHTLTYSFMVSEQAIKPCVYNGNHQYPFLPVIVQESTKLRASHLEVNKDLLEFYEKLLLFIS